MRCDAMRADAMRCTATMHGDAMHGDAMHSDVMHGDAMRTSRACHSRQSSELVGVVLSTKGIDELHIIDRCPIPTTDRVRGDIES